MKSNWKTRSRYGTGFILLSMGGLLAGCASVNPSSDYERAQVYVAEATQADSGSLGMAVEDTLVIDQIEHRLVDGLTIEEAVDIALLNNNEAGV